VACGGPAGGGKMHFDAGQEVHTVEQVLPSIATQPIPGCLLCCV
jgi:hypothetical protein